MAAFVKGARFKSLNEFKEGLKQYEAENFVNFGVESSLKLTQSETFSEEIVNTFCYKRLKYECKFAGSVRNRSNGIRSSSSFRSGCLAFISVSFKKRFDQYRLEIIDIYDQHNHPVAEEIFKNMPKQRQQIVSENGEYISNVLSVKANYRMVQTQINGMNEGKGHVVLKDLYNFNAKGK